MATDEDVAQVTASNADLQAQIEAAKAAKAQALIDQTADIRLAAAKAANERLQAELAEATAETGDYTLDRRARATADPVVLANGRKLGPNQVVLDTPLAQPAAPAPATPATPPATPPTTPTDAPSGSESQGE